jgi:hypothetical protein
VQVHVQPIGESRLTIVFGLVPEEIFSAREAFTDHLSAIGMGAEQCLSVPFIVFAQVAESEEG